MEKSILTTYANWLESSRLKLSDKHSDTVESINNLIELYEAWGKPEEAVKWRAKLPRNKSTDHQ